MMNVSMGMYGNKMSKKISSTKESGASLWRHLIRGFTIVELLIVVVVIAILATIVLVSYRGVTARAKDAKIQSEIKQIDDNLRAYYLTNGEYPATQSVSITQTSGAVVYVDSKCTTPTSASVISSSDWIPGLDMALPQSDGTTGSRGDRGCYIYQSDGKNYILSAWNMVATGPQTSTLYRRVGFREMNLQQYYLCNHQNIGGANPSPYNISRDMYKYSYTTSNITSCGETPPSGA